MAQQVELFGLAESAVYDYTIAQLEAEKAAIASIDANAEEVKILERKIALYQQMKGSAIALEGLDAEKQAWETWSRDVEQIFGRVGQSLTDKIVGGGFKARDLLKDIFKAVTFNILINPVMSALQGTITNQLGGLLGYSNPSQSGGVLGMASNASSLHSAFSGGLLNTVSLNSQVTGALNGLTQVTNLGNLAYVNGLAANQIGAGTLAAGVIYAGIINASQVNAGIFTGLVFRTAASGARVEISGTSNDLVVYNSSGVATVRLSPTGAGGGWTMFESPSTLPAIFAANSGTGVGVQVSAKSSPVSAINNGDLKRGCDLLAYKPNGSPNWSNVGDTFYQGLHNRRKDERRKCLAALN